MGTNWYIHPTYPRQCDSETKFMLSKIAEEQRMDIIEKAGALEAFQKQLKKDNKGKIDN